MKKKVLLFTGAGVSQESGIKTFRDSVDGLWNNYSIQEVASIGGWREDKSKVLDFYNARRKESKFVSPNKAHELIAALSKYFEVTVVTQNVDGLHERSGSSNVIHLHGELNKVRSTFNPRLIYEWENDLNIGDKCVEGSQLRPHIVWFGEVLDPDLLQKAKDITSEVDVIIVVGTSMQVYPAATLPWLGKENSLIYYIDPSEIEFHIPSDKRPFFYHIKEKASIGMEKVYNELMELFNEKGI